MKLTTTLFTAISMAFAFAGSANAVLLLSDNFNTVTSFTAASNADQSGPLAPASYTTSDAFGGTVTASRGAGSLVLGGADRFLLSQPLAYINFANTNNTPIQFSFDYVSTSADPTDWVGFMVGQTSAWMDSAGANGPTEFSALFRNNGGGVRWLDGGAGTNFSYTKTGSITVELRNTVGTGSAFNGTGSVLQFWEGANSIGTFTIHQLDNTGGNSNFIITNWGGGTIDNFRVTATIPEPSAALLGGLGVLALLRRRR